MTTVLHAADHDYNSVACFQVMSAVFSEALCHLVDWRSMAKGI